MNQPAFFELNWNPDRIPPATTETRKPRETRLPWVRSKPRPKA